MLYCQANYSAGTGNKNCSVCRVLDNESHRINDCVVFRSTNLYDSKNKIDFNRIYTDDMQSILDVISIVLKIWDLGAGKNVMRRCTS